MKSFDFILLFTSVVDGVSIKFNGSTLPRFGQWEQMGSLDNSGIIQWKKEWGKGRVNAFFGYKVEI